MVNLTAALCMASARCDRLVLLKQLLVRGVCSAHTSVSLYGAAMHTSAATRLYKHHRFPAKIIRHGVWLSYRFGLSYRDVEELRFARGVIVTYEAIRKGCRKFGQQYENQLRQR